MINWVSAFIHLLLRSLVVKLLLNIHESLIYYRKYVKYYFIDFLQTVQVNKYMLTIIKLTLIYENFAN